MKTPQQFNKDFKTFLQGFLSEKGSELAKEQKDKIRAAGLVRSGKLASSPAYEVKQDTKTAIISLVVTTWYTGRILDKKTIKTQGKAGARKGKFIHPDELKEWIKKVGLQNFNLNGQSPQRALNNIAWGIRRKWIKERKRSGKPWGYKKMKTHIDTALEEEIVDVYTEFFQNQL